MIASNPFIYMISDPEINQACSSLLSGNKIEEKANEENKNK